MIIQRITLPMNSVSFVLKFISIRAIILQDRYKYQLENRHPYLLMEHDFRGTAEEIFSCFTRFSAGDGFG